VAYVLKDDMAVKMAVLYVINKFKDGVTGEVLTEVAIYACGIDYFTLRQVLFTLEQDEFITSFTNEYGEMFVINEAGEQALEFFVNKLPYHFREDVTEYILGLSPDELPSNKFYCDFFPANDLEYNVYLEYKENGTTTLKMEFTAGDRENAQKTVNLINKNKDKLFGEIFKCIMALD